MTVLKGNSMSNHHLLPATMEDIITKTQTSTNFLTDGDILKVEAKAMQLMIRAAGIPPALRARCEARLAAIRAELEGYPGALYQATRAKYVEQVKQVTAR
jgi:hypothetical protein